MFVTPELANKWYFRVWRVVKLCEDVDQWWTCLCHRKHMTEDRCPVCGRLFGYGTIYTASDGYQIANVWLRQYVERHPDVDWFSI